MPNVCRMSVGGHGRWGISVRLVDQHAGQLADLGYDSSGSSGGHLLAGANPFEWEDEPIPLAIRGLQQVLCEIRRHWEQSILPALFRFRINAKAWMSAG